MHCVFYVIRLIFFFCFERFLSQSDPTSGNERSYYVNLYEVLRHSYLQQLDYGRKNYGDAYHRHKLNSIIEYMLRSLRLSFSFINSIVLIILLKPFNEPIVKFLNNCLRRLKKIKRAVEMIITRFDIDD